ncbi:MAG: hypothetical protein LUC21_02700 [Oscillospiraceae bacterium]|nr:hypothetical protein [Oscillospiraceae bacterium]MCC8157118.1 hypothetical protein [Oscillospiraceae bacterium]MCD8358767.1 hypothetical protein [Oscillospiraceae bacterium]MCD8389062.1 hypothetical protein [Oscillospiraceae bacterium]
MSGRVSGARLRLFQRLKKTKIYRPGMHNGLPKRLNWEQIEAKRRQEENAMLKGMSRRVVVIKSPDSRMFEQAIFIVREDHLKRKDNSRSDILREAQEVADRYIRSALSTPGRRERRIVPPAFIAGGAALLAAVGWLLLHFFH